MSTFTYKPRPVVSTASRMKIAKLRGRGAPDPVCTWKSIIKLGEYYHARWKWGATTYKSQGFKTEAEAKLALPGLKARAERQAYREL